jgi:hypothetical protein
MTSVERDEYPDQDQEWTLMTAADLAAVRRSIPEPRCPGPRRVFVETTREEMLSR